MDCKITPQVNANPIEFNSTTDVTHASKLLLTINPPVFLAKTYNYLFKKAHTCDLCSEIIPIINNNTYKMCEACNCKYHDLCYEQYVEYINSNMCFKCKCKTHIVNTIIKKDD